MNLVPVAGVGEHHLGQRVDPDRGELALGRVDHWLEVSEVRRVDGHLGGNHDLLGGHRRLGVVALQPPA
jgi:hypothetical protein